MDKCENKCKYVKVDKILDKLDILSGIMVDKNDALVIKEIIEDMQGEDVKPVVHGNWGEKLYIDNPAGYLIEYPLYRCSECGESYYEGTASDNSYDRFLKYCPNCGAKMDGGNE